MIFLKNYQENNFFLKIAYGIVTHFLLAVVPVVSLRVAVADGEAKICGLFNGQRYEISANGQSDRLSHPAEHLDQGIDRELGRFLVHDIGHAWPRHHQDLRRISLLEVMLLNPVGQFRHQLLLELTRVVDLLVRSGLQPLGFLGRKSELQEQVRARFRHMADFSIHRHFLPFSR